MIKNNKIDERQKDSPCRMTGYTRPIYIGPDISCQFPVIESSIGQPST